MKVLVSGGGIGGLSAALALARIGAEVTVFEKRNDLREEGAGIQLGPNGTRVLNRLGVAARLQPYITTPESLLVHDAASSTPLANLPLGDWLKERHGSPYWVAHRSDLHAALLGAAEENPLITIERGVVVDSVEHYPDEILAVSAGTIIGAGSFLVAADGLHSSLRTTFFKTAPAHYSGKSAARTVISIDEVPNGIRKDSVGIWLHHDGHVVHYPVRSGSEFAIVVIRREREIGTDWAAPVPTDWAGQAVADFTDPVRKLIAASRSWRKWSLAEHAPLHTWVKDRVVLLGDAAHPVLPFLAQGAVLALEDSITLAQSISDVQSELEPMGDASQSRLQSALMSYQSDRQKRAARVQSASRRNGRIYHLSGAMRQARNITLQLTPPDKLMAGYDWLYGWKPRA